MGNDLKGHELGKGLTQRKDKKYSAKFQHKKKRTEKTFDSLADAKQWLLDMKYSASHYEIAHNPEITVQELYEDWIKMKEAGKRPNTVRNYRERFETNILPEIGRMKVVDVRGKDCQSILNNMFKQIPNGPPGKGYAYSTMEKTMDCLQIFFKYALLERVISISPVNRNTVSIPINSNPTREEVEEDDKPIDFFTVEEEKKFIDIARHYSNYNQYRLVLELGLRTSELIGLQFKYIDFKKKELKVVTTLEYRYSEKKWNWGPPKTKSGKRIIKLTPVAYDILMEIKEGKRNIRENTPEEFRDLVFLNRTGFPTKNSTYDADLVKICDKAGIKRVSMHDLRHTMASRFAEMSFKTGRGCANIKVLSQILGHKTVGITIDRYVHNTDVTLESEMLAYSEYLAIQLGEKHAEIENEVSPEIKAKIRAEYKEELLAEIEEEIRLKIIQEMTLTDIPTKMKSVG